MNRKAIILGIKSYKLSNKEKKLFKKYKPWGIILFSRNIKSIDQLKKLTFEIKKTLKDKNYPILIDQEGGKVCRLNKIIDHSFFSQSYFGNLYKKNKKLFFNIYKVYIDQVCKIFRHCGININTVPVLDVERKYAHKVIGTRSFSKDVNIVSKLGKHCIELYKTNKIATVMKHIPGHGKSNFDSHKRTPTIKAKKDELFKKDFKPFKSCNSLFAMTAHAIFPIFDKENTATHSNIIIKDIIRKYINFRGILISDDISMKSLKYTIEVNAIKSLESGCNLTLHCNGNINEMTKLLMVVPKIDKFTQKKTSQFYKFLR